MAKIINQLRNKKKCKLRNLSVCLCVCMFNVYMSLNDETSSMFLDRKMMSEKEEEEKNFQSIPFRLYEESILMMMMMMILAM